MNNISDRNILNSLPQQLKEEYIKVWVEQGTARARWFRGEGNTRDVERSQVRMMRTLIEIAKHCPNAEQYLACKNSLDRQAYSLLRIEESYSFGSWLSAPTELSHQMAQQVA